MKILVRSVCVLICWTVAGAAWSQTRPQGATGSLRGYVKDQQQALLPGVLITVRSAGATVQTAVTDTQGFYRLLGLSGGTYSVTAELSNFTTYERQEIVVEQGADLGLDIVLDVAAFADRVDVFAPAPARGYRATDSTAATRIAIPLNDLPINVQVVTSDFLSDAVILDVVDVMRYKAVNANRDVRFNSMFIRGFNNRILKRNGIRRDLNWGTANVERVEVVKGPASILYGEANPGGTVLYTTKQPVARTFLDVTAQGGAPGFFRGIADAGARLGSDRALFRFVGERQRSNDYYNGAYVDRWMFNPMFRWTPNSRLTLDAEFEYTNHKEQQVAYMLQATQAVLDAPPMTLDNLPATVPFHHNELVGFNKLTDLFSWGKGNLPKGFQAQSPDSHVDLRTAWTELTANYRLPNAWTLRGKLAYENTRDDELQFGSNGSAALLAGGLLGTPLWDGRQNTLKRFTGFTETTGQFRLGPILNTAMIGYEHRSDDLNQPLLVPPTAMSDPVSGRALPVKGPRVVMPVINIPLVRFANVPGAGAFQSRASTLLRRDSIYGFNQFDLPGDRWLALLGLRYERAENNPFSTGVQPQNRFDATTAQLGFVYKFKPETSAFFNFSQSYLPIESVNPNGETFAPETGNGFEAGVRTTTANGRLAATFTVWDNAREGILQQDNARTFNDPVNNPRNLIYLEKSGLWRARGVDTEIYVTATNDLQLVGTFAWIPYAKIVENASRVASEGARLRYTPEAAASLWGRYTLPLQTIRGLYVFGGLTSQSRTEWDGTVDYAVVTFAPWTSIDAGIGFKKTIDGRPVDFQLVGKNLTDQELTITYHPQQRRSLYLTASFHLTR